MKEKTQWGIMIYHQMSLQRIQMQLKRKMISRATTEGCYSDREDNNYCRLLMKD